MNRAEFSAGEKTWAEVRGEGPIIATAIHDGHDLRPDVAEIMKLSERDRLREEDPYTSIWVDIVDTQIVALRSRFEMDLNRPREQAIYRDPEDAWGLDIWSTRPSDEIVERSLAQYDAYYRRLREVCDDAERRHGKFVLYDIHSYNHCRDGEGHPEEDPQENPEVNIGTGTMDRERWSPVVDRFIADLRSFDFMGRNLDVRKNVKFKGGNQVRWLHNNYRRSGVGLAIEFKKFWMDEWTGEKDERMVAELRKALAYTIPGVLEELARI